ncbi:MAG: hypothetical protein EF812_07125 [Methanosarcinales archaeon]|nr:MAG: hypothetical protein EF812_07125 [Methanosarcinales archaeon]
MTNACYIYELKALRNCNVSVFTKKPLYEVHVKPESGQSLEQMAAIAKRYGYAGMIVATDACKPEITDAMPSDFLLYHSTELNAQSATQVRKKAQLLHGKTDCIILRGGSETINRAGVENRLIDILSSPKNINHVLAKLASNNNVAIEFDLGAIIHTEGSERCRVLSVYRNNLKLVRKYNVLFGITTTPVSCYDFRAPREMAALAMLFGMKREEAVYAMSVVPRQIIEQRSLNFITAGVKLV